MRNFTGEKKWGTESLIITLLVNGPAEIWTQIVWLLLIGPFNQYHVALLQYIVVWGFSPHSIIHFHDSCFMQLWFIHFSMPYNMSFCDYTIIYLFIHSPANEFLDCFWACQFVFALPNIAALNILTCMATLCKNSSWVFIWEWDCWVIGLWMFTLKT